MTEKPHEQLWYKETCKRLGRYPVQLSRMKYLELKLMHDCMPANRLIASYGERVAGGVNDNVGEEKELNRLQVEVKGVQYALEGLTIEERKIIELKYFEDNTDAEIMDKLYIGGKDTYYSRKDRGVKKVAECLGFLKLD